MCLKIKFIFLINFIYIADSYSFNVKTSFTVLDKIYTSKTDVPLLSLLEEYKLDKAFIQRVSKTIKKESKKYKLDPIFIASLIFAESSFRVDATSRVGAIGLMQIMPRTGLMIADRLGIEITCSSQLYDPTINIRFGVWYINHLLKQFKDPIIAITAYNFGPGNVNRMLKKYPTFPRYPYLFKVVSYYNKLQRKISIAESVAKVDLEKRRRYKAMNLNSNFR